MSVATGQAAGRRHIPVMPEEVIEGLRVRPGGTYLDGTIGCGGHSLEILRRFEGTRVIGLDRDAEALENARRLLEPFGDRVSLHHADYRDMDKAAASAGIRSVDGVLLDLGVSSLQLDDARRGFSFLQDGPLDMRMDQTAGPTAADIVNSMAERDLADCLRDYGEERLARRVASAIVRARVLEPIRTTGQLASIVASVPGMGRVRDIHPATRTFQALRIAVNAELEGVERALPIGVGLLAEGGRMAVISFHSLEDRIVKRSFRAFENPCRCPPRTPVCLCDGASLGRVVTKRPLRPTEEEVRKNPRSRSARLRIFERESAGRVAPAPGLDGR